MTNLVFGGFGLKDSQEYLLISIGSFSSVSCKDLIYRGWKSLYHRVIVIIIRSEGEKSQLSSSTHSNLNQLTCSAAFGIVAIIDVVREMEGGRPLGGLRVVYVVCVFFLDWLGLGESPSVLEYFRTSAPGSASLHARITPLPVCIVLNC